MIGQGPWARQLDKVSTVFAVRAKITKSISGTPKKLIGELKLGDLLSE